MHERGGRCALLLLFLTCEMPPLDPPWATRVRLVSQECVPCAFCGVLAIEACPGVKDSDAWGDEWTYPVCIKESSAGWKVWAPTLALSQGPTSMYLLGGGSTVNSLDAACGSVRGHVMGAQGTTGCSAQHAAPVLPACSKSRKLAVALPQNLERACRCLSCASC